jgi:hypothetical protein
VIFDGIERAAARGIQLVLADTAGRLHTKTNLMDELRKVRRVAEKGRGRVTEVLLVIDATTGQNGLTQAREFGYTNVAAGADGSGVTGVLTKLDGSARADRVASRPSSACRFWSASATMHDWWPSSRSSSRRSPRSIEVSNPAAGRTSKWRAIEPLAPTRKDRHARSHRFAFAPPPSSSASAAAATPPVPPPPGQPRW